MDKKYEIFEKELSIIKDVTRRNIAIELLKGLPDYFYTIPASSTGKYHPKFTLGEGGLVRHVKASVLMANHLFPLTNFTDYEKDTIITALLLHDGFKKGLVEGKHTVHTHPIISAEYVRKSGADPIYNDIAHLIESHMGQWNTNKYDKTILPKPTTKMQKFVHWCDYLASRKDIEIQFDPILQKTKTPFHGLSRV